MKYINITSSVGHGIMQLNFAEALKLTPAIMPEKESKEEYEAECTAIYEKLKFFSDKIIKVPYEKREEISAETYDVLANLKNKEPLPWNRFARNKLIPQFESTTSFPALDACSKKKILIIPQKLLSDNACGITAAQQSLNPEVFSFIKHQDIKPVLGQHFHKVNDHDIVQALAKDFRMYVPGQEKINRHVYGIRGINHSEYANMYAQLNGSIGIAGTHTWIMLTTFPDTPQVILYNKNGVEDWKAIEKAYRAANKPIRCIGFDEKTNMKRLSKQVQNACTELGITDSSLSTYKYIANKKKTL